MSPFLDVLRSDRVLLMDGAMGTELIRAGLKPGENASTWNLLHPQRVRSVHEAYRAAGAMVGLTNTFLINDYSFIRAMQAVGRTGDRLAPWQAAYQLLGPDVFRLAAIGPVAGDATTREFDTVKQCFVPKECSNYQPHDCFHFCDAILIETCSTPRVRFAAARLQRWHSDKPLLLSMTFQHSGGCIVTSSSHPPEWFAQRAAQWNIAALGVNCGRDIDLDDILTIVRRYRDHTDLPIFVRPNAGTPKKVRGRWVYPLTPAELADRAPELLEAGVCMIGGCCGTTPQHIAALRPVVDAWNAR